MQRAKYGKYVKSSVVGGEQYKTYIPNALPPKPAINIAEISQWLEKANIAVGELNGIVEAVPDPFVINYMYIRKEAVLSSQIEGTQSTLDDLLRHESGAAAGVPVDDVTEVSSYVAAMNHGMKRIRNGFPLSVRLIREIHKILLTNSRGKHKTPGEIRRSQNWLGTKKMHGNAVWMKKAKRCSPNKSNNINNSGFALANLAGGTRPGNAYFVPPPPDNVSELMSNLEKYMHSKDQTPVLVKAALIHHQFETIHPFLDGNGRVGRLLITLFLNTQGFLRSPYLYLSLFFKQHRGLYYDMLTEPRKNGDLEKWINFFLEGVTVTAANAKKTLINIYKLFSSDEKKVSGLGRAKDSAGQVFTIFKHKPLLTIAEITQQTKLSKPTAISSVNHLIDLGIISNKSQKKWGQIYLYDGYAKLIGSGE